MHSYCFCFCLASRADLYPVCSISSLYCFQSPLLICCHQQWFSKELCKCCCSVFQTVDCKAQMFPPGKLGKVLKLGDALWFEPVLCVRAQSTSEPHDLKGLSKVGLLKHGNSGTVLCQADAWTLCSYSCRKPALSISSSYPTWPFEEFGEEQEAILLKLSSPIHHRADGSSCAKCLGFP